MQTNYSTITILILPILYQHFFLNSTNVDDTPKIDFSLNLNS